MFGRLQKEHKRVNKGQDRVSTIVTEMCNFCVLGFAPCVDDAMRRSEFLSCCGVSIFNAVSEGKQTRCLTVPA